MSLAGKGVEGHICPSLVKDWKDIYMSYYCQVMVASLWGNLERHAFGGATKILILWSGGHEFLNYGK